MKRLALVALAALGIAHQQAVNPRRQVQILTDAGHFDEAERTARGLGPQYGATLGDVLVMRGRLAAADSAFRLAIASNSRERREAEISLAELAYRHGDHAAAFKRADTLAASYERDRSGWSSDDRAAAARAYLLLGSNANWVRSALAAFDDAVAADSSNVDAMVRIGDLFLDKYNAPDAIAAYQTALRHAPKNSAALLGIGRVLDFQDSVTAMNVVQATVAANPSLVGGLLMIARAYLEAEAYDTAAVYSRRALAVDSSSSTAWALLGASAWITGDSAGYHTALTAAERLNPRPADFYEELAEAAVRNRRYADAMRLAHQAIECDSASVRGLGILGTNQLRLGDIANGRASLERAFALDPFNLWQKNTLDLLDQLAKFRTIDRGRFRIVAPPQEAELLSSYLFPLLEEAYDTLAKRYDYRPPTPIRIEIYNRHADFSVRTVGLAGLGALGVTFGTMIAMDSPSARERGDFNWGSTAWHELTHTFTLGRSNNRVPRWLSEGLSVFEERRGRPSWGADVTVEFLAAYKGGALRKPSELNEGFVQPRYQMETQFSYYLASLVCEMIYAQRGSAAFVDMLSAYRDGLGTPAVFQRVLGESMDAFDKKFDSWLRTRFDIPLHYITANDGRSAPDGEYVRALMGGAAMVERQELDSAKTLLAHAETMFPAYAGAHSPPWFLATIELQRGNAPAAIAQIERITAHNESAIEANTMEVALREQLDDDAGAARTLERMIWIWPSDPQTHTQLADIAGRLGNHALAVRERRAVVALGPSDVLEARFQLARALAANGDTLAARHEIVSVLEVAPGFEKAQKLLLDLQGKKPGGGIPPSNIRDELGRNRGTEARNVLSR